MLFAKPQSRDRGSITFWLEGWKIIVFKGAANNADLFQIDEPIEHDEVILATSCAPAHSPATHAGWTVHVAASQFAPFSSR